MSCTANDKGTLIDCELGNPLQKDTEVSSTALFPPYAFCHRRPLYHVCFCFFVPFRLVFMSYSQHHASHWVQRPSTSLCSLKRKRSETETGISYWSVGCTWLWRNNVPVMQDKCADHTTSWGIGQSGFWGGYASKWVGVFSWDYCLWMQISAIKYLYVVVPNVLERFCQTSQAFPSVTCERGWERHKINGGNWNSSSIWI